MDDWESTDTEQPSPPPGRRLPARKTIYFRFGSRVVGGTGTQVDWEHPHVLRLSRHASFVERIVWIILCPLSLLFPYWVQATFPEWTLSEHIVLKQEKDECQEEFDRECAAYDRLRCLQGRLIATCYGVTEYDGKRTLVLSDVGGYSLAEAKCAAVSEKELRPFLDQLLCSIASLGLSYEERMLDNFRLVGKGQDEVVMAVDFERVVDIASRDDIAWKVRTAVDAVLEGYRYRLDTLRDDGLLLPPRPQPVALPVHRHDGRMAIMQSWMSFWKSKLGRPVQHPPETERRHME